MSNSSVTAENFCGKMRTRKEIGMIVSECNQRSDTTRMKYWGGSGSSTGMVNDTMLSSVAYRAW